MEKSMSELIVFAFDNDKGASEMGGAVKLV
jgi:uncharacterized membrane protein